METGIAGAVAGETRGAPFVEAEGGSCIRTSLCRDMKIRFTQLVVKKENKARGAEEKCLQLLPGDYIPNQTDQDLSEKRK